MARAKEILEFWFGSSVDDAQVQAEKGKLWFGKDEQVDAEIWQRFGTLITSAGQRGLLDGPEPEAYRYLATILLLDQFVRNVFRGERRAFASDPLALQLALTALQQGHDQVLRPIERVFIYLPLEHSEDLKLQNRSVELFQGLLQVAPAGSKKAFAGFLDYAVRHREIIARFGRFPHRNAILGRESSAAELEFLKQPNSSF